MWNNKNYVGISNLEGPDGFARIQQRFAGWIVHIRDVVEFGRGIDKIDSHTGTKHTGHDTQQQNHDTESIQINHKTINHNTETQQWNFIKYFS